MVSSRNEQVLETIGDMVVDLTIDRLLTRLSLACTLGYNEKVLLDNTYMGRKEFQFRPTPDQIRTLVSENYLDPNRVFVKYEPHTRSKLEQERYRLISSVSLVDQACQRLLHGELNNLEINSWTSCPSKPGLGLSTDEALYEVATQIASIHNPAEADVSGWDISVQDWELLADSHMRCILYHNDPLWNSMIIMDTLMLIVTPYIFSDGTLIYPTDATFGVQKSGSYNTSSTNSRLRVLTTALVGSDNAMAMGDDCVESETSHAIEKYKQLGHNLKFYTRKTPSDTDVEFCSHIFKFGKFEDGYLGDFTEAYPCNPYKSLYRLLTTTVVDVGIALGQLLAFLDFTRHDPQLGKYVSIIRDDPDWSPLLGMVDEKLLTPLKFITMTKVKINPQPHKQSTKPVQLSSKVHRPQILSQDIKKLVKLAEAPRKQRNSSQKMVGVRRSVKIGPEKFKVHDTDVGVRVSGSSLYGELITVMPTTSTPMCTQIIHIPLHPYMLNSWRLQRMAQGYQKYLFKNIRVRMVSELGSQTNGLYGFAIYTSGESIPTATGISLKRFLQSNPSFQERGVWKDEAVTMPKSQFLPSYSMEATSDINSLVQGWVVGVATGVPNGTYLGDLLIEYDVEFFNATSPNSGLATNTAISLPLGATVASTWTYSFSGGMPSGLQFGLYSITLREMITGYYNTTGGPASQSYPIGSRLYAKVSFNGSNSISIYNDFENVMLGQPILAASTQVAPAMSPLWCLLMPQEEGLNPFATSSSTVAEDSISEPTQCWGSDEDMVTTCKYPTPTEQQLAVQPDCRLDKTPRTTLGNFTSGNANYYVYR